MMNDRIQTNRLILQPLALQDAPFIFELLNTAEWKQFIGDRHIYHLQDATDYIAKILRNPDMEYQVARLRETEAPIGVVTFIKRTYLSHHDIGFAFLPAYAGKGFAYEAASTFLDGLKKKAPDSYILATTIPENARSIRLLEKLGLQFREEIQLADEKLLLYSKTL
ncbi:GNAT family N-acetyltransferase [Chitinophaga nivalis]|uniref:GNAT family N-acetyltransferase n=1 Tax=Chitinophaga nivalis TaxID=2991709 RepID=A0ABT3IMA7_9BACT|nr:GNAT family N-acetyltransferase [Chitinophaga nivalis]MCW3465221.1 GNAT family N-acetyltransferase [Chitinophaga nivalis]MCW3485087.1 GNAT family N-acetyltransferase [Chitinophaga nivalis]